jgi:hypothetical protein
MPVRAVAFLRKMRGGAQAHLIEADDGRFYVVKFQNNPQHRRILINEWIATAVFEHLRIQCAPNAIVELTPDFIASNPELYIQMGTRRIPAEPGWHWGSCYPGHPDRLAVYDFLPDQLLAKVSNQQDFLGAFVADRWLGNTDSRQAVFFRAQLKEFDTGSSVHPLKKGFVARMIDHGFSFNGPYWDFPDAPMQSMYYRAAVYECVTGLESFAPWLDRLTALPMEVIDAAWRGMPPEWIPPEDQERGEWLVEQLAKRRRRLPRLIEDARSGRVNPFPNWS